MVVKPAKDKLSATPETRFARYERPQGGQNGYFSSLEIGTKNQSFFKSLKLAANFRVIHLIAAVAVYLPVYETVTHTAQEPDSLFGRHAMMRLQFTRALSFACKGRLLTLLTVVPLLIFIAQQ